MTTDLSNFDKRWSDAHFVPFISYYYCTILYYFSNLTSSLPHRTSIEASPGFQVFQLPYIIRGSGFKSEKNLMHFWQWSHSINTRKVSSYLLSSTLLNQLKLVYSRHCDEKKKPGLKQFPWIRTIFMFLDPD